jgi:hypothetical protein
MPPGGVAHRTPHAVQHTVAGDVVNTDVDLVTVQKLLVHASVQTTASYGRRGERAKKKAVGTLHVPYALIMDGSHGGKTPRGVLPQLARVPRQSTAVRGQTTRASDRRDARTTPAPAASADTTSAPAGGCASPPRHLRKQGLRHPLPWAQCVSGV